MYDKRHNDWIISDIVTDARIFKGQSVAFHFLSDMAYNFDNSIEMLKGIRQIATMNLLLELLERKCLYLKMANGIGRLLSKEET